MSKYDIYVCGMRAEHYLGEGPGDVSFNMEPYEYVKEILFCTTANERVKLIIECTNEGGWCGSGYTTASFGFWSYKKVNDFGPATHLPKDHKPIKLLNMQYDGETNKIQIDENNNTHEEDFGVFVYDDWGDSYYPNSFVEVNYELFEELPRAMKKRPVWIFYGESGTGKSTLASMLSEEKNVYETDSANNGILPDEILADIVVFGNKWKDKFTIDDIKHRIVNAEIICVAFDK